MHKITGVHTALVTPFDEGGLLNESVLREQIRYQLENDIDGLVVLGTTGEAPTLNKKEKETIIKIAIDENKKATKSALLTVGTGSYSTAETIENTAQAKNMGADCALIVTPYYNKPTQKGLYQHFKAIADAVDLPIIVYNIAARTGQNLTTETLKSLSEIKNIMGVKEASGSLNQMMDVYQSIVMEREDFCLLSGDDALTLPAMAIGAHGVISVVSNLVPQLIKKLTNYLTVGDFEAARKLHNELLPLFKAAFIETNPIPIKVAMNHLGMNVGPCRLPLSELVEENEAVLKRVLENYMEFAC